MAKASRDDFASIPIESLIKSAENFVVPSENLRPRTLEAAREAAADRAGFVRLAKLFLFLLFCSAASVPAVDRLTRWHEQSVSPSAAEIQHQAVELSHQKGVGPHWGLFEAFNRLRNSQSENLNRLNPPK